ncbi:MAG: hypothetical protein ACLQVD_12920 [Capsulimonadaceae bacterium]
MTISEIMPSLSELDRKSKLDAVQFLVAELASEETGLGIATDVASNTHDLDADVEKAIEFYRTSLRELLEPEHNGDHVAIHVPSGSYLVDKWAGQASRALRAKHPEGGGIVVHKIGPADYGLVARMRGERPK